MSPDDCADRGEELDIACAIARDVRIKSVKKRAHTAEAGTPAEKREMVLIPARARVANTKALGTTYES